MTGIYMSNKESISLNGLSKLHIISISNNRQTAKPKYFIVTDIFLYIIVKVFCCYRCCCTERGLQHKFYSRMFLLYIQLSVKCLNVSVVCNKQVYIVYSKVFCMSVFCNKQVQTVYFECLNMSVFVRKCVHSVLLQDVHLLSGICLSVSCPKSVINMYTVHFKYLMCPYSVINICIKYFKYLSMSEDCNKNLHSSFQVSQCVRSV